MARTLHFTVHVERNCDDMKKLILSLIVLFAMTLPTFAGSGTATISGDNIGKMQVFVNGRVVNHKPSHRVQMANLRSGKHKVRIKVFKYGQTRVIWDDIMVRPYEQNNYVLSRNHRGGSFYLRKLHQYPVRPSHVHTDHCSHGTDYFDDYNDWNYNGPDYFGDNRCGHATHYDIKYLKDDLRRTSFERDRWELVNRHLGQRNILARDVRDLMEYFSFESTRLKFAKYAVHRTCDTHNYYIVNDGFKFSSSARDLDRYMRKYARAGY